MSQADFSGGDGSWIEAGKREKGKRGMVMPALIAFF
jgi:hypothetical protein